MQRHLAGELQSVPQDDSQATYVKLPPRARDLRLDLTADGIRWRCRTLATLRLIGIAGVEAAMAVGFRRVVGPPTGKPPALGPLSVAFDATDARVSVWRKLPGMSKLRRLRRLVELAGTPVR